MSHLHDWPLYDRPFVTGSALKNSSRTISLGWHNVRYFTTVQQSLLYILTIYLQRLPIYYLLSQAFRFKALS